MALQSLVEQANGNARNAHTRLNKTEACAQRGMLYAPGRSGDGCIEAHKPNDAGVNFTVIWDRLNGLSNGLNNLTANVNSINSCAGQGRMFNGSTCVSGSHQLQCRAVMNSGPGPHYASRAECNSDEVLTGGGAQSETVGTQLCRGLGSSYIHLTAPSGNAWIADGYRPEGGEACTMAYAICCKIKEK